METPSQKNLLWFILGLIVLLLISRVGAYSESRPNSNLYQVVLLVNDQAFYGKLHNVNSNYPYLTDVYYLNPKQASAGTQFTVIKRGIDEMHAPADRFYMARENILYWENVGENSLVVRGIAEDKKVRANQPTPANK